MKIDISNTKIFTIFLSLLYIFGVLCVFFEYQILIAFIILLFLIFMVLKSNLSLKRILILYLIFFIGIIRANNSDNIESVIDDIKANNVILKGQIVSNIETFEKNKRIKFFLNVDEAFINYKKYSNVNSKVLVNLNTENKIFKDVLIGDYITIKGNLRIPSSATNPYQFDYKKYLLNKNCKSILYSENEIYKINNKLEFGKNLRDSWYFVLQKFEIKRNEIIKKHSEYVKSPNLEILGGIVFGNEAVSPDEEIKESFKNSGLLHLLAASGLNVALIYGIWLWIANLIRFPYNFSIIFGAGFVVLYTFMTGFPPSILRASLMLLFVLFGKMIDRNADSVALVFFVGFLMLLIQPKMIFDVGFQLSFIVTLGLLIACPVLTSKFDKLDKKFKEKHKNATRFKKYFLFLFSPNALVGLISVPLVAQVCVAPLQMYYFNNFALFSLFANIAVVPFIGVLSFLGFISSIVALIPFLDNHIVYLFDLIANPLLTLLVKISGLFSSFKYSLVTTNGLNVFQIFVFWAIFYFLILNVKNNFKNKIQKYVFISLFIGFLMSFIPFENFNKDLEVMMFDVGSADSFLIKTPENKYILIDTGTKNFKSTTSAQIIINKYLKNKKINKLEKLIITHFDADHCGGVIDILDKNKIGEVIYQKINVKNDYQDEIIKYLENNKIQNKVLNNNEIVYKEKDLNIKTFFAEFNRISDKKLINETSIITLLSYKDKNILFMADAGIDAFFKIEKYLPEKIDIIKIGHHGAKNSVNKIMLDRIKPNYAVISVGENNFYHPDSSIINLLFDEKIKTITSKKYGFVKIKVDKNIETYNFNRKTNKFFEILFNKEENIPFHKTKYVQNFIQSNL